MSTMYPMSLFECSSEQLDIYNQLKSQLEHEDSNIVTIFNEYDLLRFLKSRKFELQAAYEICINCYNWRVKNNIDNILNVPDIMPERTKLLSKLIPSLHHGFDKKGRPIYIERNGAIIPDLLLATFTDKEMLHHHIIRLEESTKLAKEKSAENGKVMDNFFTILDLEASLDHLKILNYSKTMSIIDQNYYPERLGVMFIINAPSVFSVAWNIVKMWLDDRTKSKIFICGTDYKSKLLELVDADQLPFEYGGNCTGECHIVPCIEPLVDQVKECKINEEKLNLTSVTIAAGNAHSQNVEAKAGETYYWYVKVNDVVGLTIDFLNKDCVSESILPRKKYEAYQYATQGTYTCTEDGILAFRLDNEASYFSSIKVNYALQNERSRH